MMVVVDDKTHPSFFLFLFKWLSFAKQTSTDCVFREVVCVCESQMHVCICMFVDLYSGLAIWSLAVNPCHCSLGTLHLGFDLKFTD